MSKIEIRFMSDPERITYRVDDISEVWKCMTSYHSRTAFVAYNAHGDTVFINARAIERAWPLDEDSEK